MNFDDVSERDLLAASAYLDDEATPEERALVESSPELLDLVSRLRGPHLAIAQFEVSASQREASIEAALAVFDQLGTPAATAGAAAAVPAAAVLASPPPAAPSGNVLSFERRRRQYRFVGGVAAAMVLVLGGLVLARGGTDDDREGVADAPASKQAPVEAPAATDAAAAQEDDELAAAEMAPMSDAPAGTEAPAAGAQPSDTTLMSALPALDDIEQLREFAATARVATQEPVGTAAPAADAFPCVGSDEQYIGEVSYQGTPAVVVLTADGSELRAVEFDTCTVLATATP